MAGSCYDIDLGCLELDGPCTGGGGNIPTIQLTGFPQAQVDYKRQGPDGGMIGVVPVGTSVTLYAIRVVGANAPINAPDTIRMAAWRVSDTTRATITAAADGAGLLTGRAPGLVYIFVNGIVATTWSCENNGCTRVTIEVTPPTSP